MRRNILNRPPLVAWLLIALIIPAIAHAQTAPPEEKQKMTEVAKQLNNPVADLWALNFQFNRYYSEEGRSEPPRTKEASHEKRI